ncbi:hypothetical protein SNE40_005460 [Patella caerulea]|uniref:Fibrinogen C-terminal domain-containing protein n=1 Tax=Patella caerulea TaxID=87958 RepID=A0AAN8KA87_PATCE
MVARFSLLIPIFQLFMIASGTFKSNFLQTEVLEELKSCKLASHNILISEMTTVSLIACGRRCLKDGDCRRFMYDEETKQCSLYESGENCITDEDVNRKICFRLLSVCTEVNCARCPIGYYGDQCQHIIQDCSDGYQKSVTPQKDLLSYIQPTVNGAVLEVICLFKYGGLTYLLYRDVRCKETDFNKTWNEYSTGFGNANGNYWLGLENIFNILQNHNRFKLAVGFTFDDHASQLQGYYRDFHISNANDNYSISLGEFSNHPQGGPGNSLTDGTFSINGRPFSTYDRDYSNNDCPVRFNSGWWYLEGPVCSRANVNGRRPEVGVPFEATWHWQDNLGTGNEFDVISLRIYRE